MPVFHSLSLFFQVFPSFSKNIMDFNRFFKSFSQTFLDVKRRVYRQRNVKTIYFFLQILSKFYEESDYLIYFVYSTTIYRMLTTIPTKQIVCAELDTKLRINKKYFMIHKQKMKINQLNKTKWEDIFAHHVKKE